MIWKQIFYHLHSLILLVPGFGQELSPQVIGQLHKDIQECSGIALLPSGHFAQINDSGNPPCIFFTDTSGTLLDLECLPFAKNVDWEDLAYGDGHLYVGDFGNNRNLRTDLKIYRLGITASDSVFDAGTIHFRYARQNNFPAAETNRHFDLEAMVYANDSIFLFSKNRTKPFTGYTYLYALPAEPGRYVIAPRDSFYLGQGAMHLHWVGGAALNAKGDKLALLGYDKLWLFSDFQGTDFFKGRYDRYLFKELSQKESMDFLNDSTLIITDEKADFFGGGYVYKLDLSQVSRSHEWPVSISPEKVIEDSLELTFEQASGDHIYWEIFNTKGERVKVGTIEKEAQEKSLQYAIPVSDLPAGGYVLNVIISDRPHAFKLKKLLKKQD